MSGEPNPYGAAPLTALLGATNTGKTYRAIEGMLDHDSGIIGLPLRLLAREVYDKVVARVGSDRVALVTGEEKRVPRRPDYWVCTVESMPRGRPVDFVAVDEVQLCAHPQRGHVFTDRVLHWRGRRETLLLGAPTMEGVLSELVPGLTVKRLERLSTLSHIAPARLGTLPRRSALVAFSAPRVYELAERLRQRRGGAAVVLGALSPRTRNAQVALYEAGEVDYLVATDAIGMGLNLDVDHVAFSALRKFDGRRDRDLRREELGQIAGRAGRHHRNGTFGVLEPIPDLEPETVRALERHRYAPVRRIIWRNSELDFSSLDALQASLARRPRDPRLRLVDRSDDTDALEQLAADPQVRARASAEARVELLWEVCQIPDFRKLLVDHHLRFLRDVFIQLTEGEERIREPWMSERIARLDDERGGLDTLMTRIAFIRTWTYVTHHARWVPNAEAWQARAREVEDRLSDALHDRLTRRFVERPVRAAGWPGRDDGDPSPGAPSRRDSRRDGGPSAASARPTSTSRDAETPPSTHHPFAAIAHLLDAPAPAVPDDAVAAHELLQRPDEAFTLDAQARWRVDGEPLARLTRGTTPLSPAVVLVDPRWQEAPPAALIRHLHALRQRRVEGLLAAVSPDAIRRRSSALRGLAYALRQGLGRADRREVAPQLSRLTKADRAWMAETGVHVTRRAVVVEAAFAPPHLPLRAALFRAFEEDAPDSSVPDEVALLDLHAAEGTRRWLEHLGWVDAGDRAVHASRLSWWRRALAQAARDAGTLDPRAKTMLLPLLQCEDTGTRGPSLRRLRLFDFVVEEDLRVRTRGRREDQAGRAQPPSGSRPEATDEAAPSPRRRRRRRRRGSKRSSSPGPGATGE